MPLSGPCSLSMLLKYALDRNLQTPSHQAMVRACFVARLLNGREPRRAAMGTGNGHRTGSLQGTPGRRPWKGGPEGRRGPGV